MIFNTSWFFVFFALFFLGTLLFRAGKKRFYFILCASVIFYFYFAGVAGVLPVIVTTVIVYLIGLKLDKAQGSDRKKWFVVGLSVPLICLIAFKYRVFLTAGLGSVWPGELALPETLLNSPALPLGLSFFTFEFIHYLFEVYKGNPAIRRPASFAMFAVYFPSLVAGPIKRYQHFLDQAEPEKIRPASNDLILEGAAQALLGFFKKLVIADNALIAIRVLEAREDISSTAVLALISLQSIRILFDFSGYSDIAIGLSKMAGIILPKNFNFPYAALNPSDFWNRWHMSLSSWIRDYLYIPLGGNRHGQIRKAVHLFVAMGLCGLWHGAAWNFVIWGLYHGVGLAVHSAYRKWSPKLEKSGIFSTVFAWALNIVFVCYGWLLFFYPLDQVYEYTKALLSF